jgi:hypothetical protein
MPIGSFESGWENYDHTSGPALREEGKTLLKGGTVAPNWLLRLGTEDFTDRLISAEVTFSREGEAGMRFNVLGSLRALQYERARVSFSFGYGTKVVPYFRGRLADPFDATSGLNSEATAYALKTELGQRYFAQRLDYGEWDLRDAFDDVIDRFGADTDRFEFRGTHSTELAPDIGEFGLEVSLSEALDTILEPMQFVMYDQPGGMVIVERSHLASLGTDEVFSGAGTYEPQDYPKDGFTFSESMRTFYSSVVIFRRDETFAGGGGPTVPGLGPPAGRGSPHVDTPEDEYAVYAEETIANSGQFNVQQGRNYLVPDYPGGQEHAEREALLLKTAIERGVGRFEWVCHPIDFSIGDHFTVIRHEQIVDPDTIFDPATYSVPQMDAVSYACVADEITFTLVARDDASSAPSEGRWTMTVSGYAFEKERTTIRPGSSTSIGLAVAPS